MDEKRIVVNNAESGKGPVYELTATDHDGTLRVHYAHRSDIVLLALAYYSCSPNVRELPEEEASAIIRQNAENWKGVGI